MTIKNTPPHQAMLEILQWHHEMGVDEAIGEEPVDCLRVPMLPVTNDAVIMPAPVSMSVPPSFNAPKDTILQARRIADNCHTLDELEQAVRSFDGCALKRTANHTVFCDGNPQAEIMVIGEAPGASEDMQGIPFCGESGKLLDMMFSAIGLDRKTNIYLSNCLFWRPPGNRVPSPEELAMCLPFVERHIALVAPKLLILSGGTATSNFLASKEAITKLRQRMHEYTNPYLQAPIAVAVLFHPSYLLRQPSQKKQTWFDLLKIKHYIQEQNIKT